MDYNELVEGTTVYLPVNHPGALLFVGDGHAAQGDGELTGDALETSMDIEFTVDLIEGRSFGHPLFENAEYLISVGIGGSLDQALQMATSGHHAVARARLQTECLRGRGRHGIRDEIRRRRSGRDAGEHRGEAAEISAGEAAKGVLTL